MSIKDWLATHGLKEYAGKFEEHKIDDENQLPLLALTPDDLRELGIKIGHRNTFLNAIAQLGVVPGPVVATPLATARVDLIRRLVAVAISVGFTARLAKMDWLTAGKLPEKLADWEEVMRLGTAMLFIIVGWEWYHRDVDTRPLNKGYRFSVDILIVLTSTVLLLSSTTGSGHLWLLSIVAIMVLYVVWDIFCIFEYPATYAVAPGHVLQVYRRGFVNGPHRGPITNALWALYFCVLAYLAGWHFALGNYSVFLSCSFVVLGIMFLRQDGNYPNPQRREGYGIIWRGFLIIGLLIVYFGIVSAIRWVQ